MTARIALLPGDGVGPEVVAEARRCVDELGLDVEWSELDWGSDHWLEHGVMMPPDAVERLRAFDAVLLGAVGRPDIPDHVTLWGLLLPIRQRLDLWANVRPVRLLEACRARWPAARPATSTCCSCARTPRASTRASAAARIRATPARSASRPPSSRAPASSASSSTRSRSPASGEAWSRARPSPTPRATATCSGTRSPRPSPSATPTSATSACSWTRSRRAWCCGPTASTSSSPPTSSATS